MTVVVDLGCRTDPRYPADESMMRLISAYEPRVYYGFDPHPDVAPCFSRVDGCDVWVLKQAAWVRDGEIAYDPRPDRPLAAAVGSGPERVPCFALATWLRGVNREPGERLVLKLDVEGAEYPLLLHLLNMNAARLVDLLLVEWHDEPEPSLRARILELWPGEVGEW